LKKLTAKEVSLFKDSKKLSEKQREECFTLIQQLQKKGKLIAVAAFTTVQEIDKYGMTNAECLAIIRGLKMVFAGQDKLWQGRKLHLVIDGKSDFTLHKYYPDATITPIIHGDDTVKEISMASIIAKVSRDRVMNALPKKYHKYGFSQHKGYGTQLHKETISQY
jgi:ribonuclease HII